jgi:hypothetical protein
MANPTGLAASWQSFLVGRGVVIPEVGASWPAVWWTEAAIGACVFVLLLVGMPRAGEPASR